MHSGGVNLNDRLSLSGGHYRLGSTRRESQARLDVRAATSPNRSYFKQQEQWHRFWGKGKELPTRLKVRQHKRSDCPCPLFLLISPPDLSILSRSKRRARAPFVNDENADPDSIHHGRDSDDQSNVGLFGHESPIHKRSIPSAVKSAVGPRRVALSPRKGNGQRKVFEEEPSMWCPRLIYLRNLTCTIEDESVSQLPTPKTPRHRDALSKRVPVTPRHRIGRVGIPLTPRTPRTPTSPSNALTVYNCARQLFTRSANPGRLVGRECERKEMHRFLKEGIESRKGRCMYVSGPPGTGKSALVSEVCQGISSTEGVKTSYINCMSAKCSKDVYGKLLEELAGDNVGTEQDDIARLRALFIPKQKSPGLVYVVTLDEIDFLLTLDLEILYTLFEWSLHQSSRLIVVGIANALDLTDRFLPRLKARNLKPRLLPFLPYTAPQIASVITTKLKSLSSTNCGTPSDYVPFLHPTAIQLCSKKIAAQTGDLRKAFDIVRRTIDVIEAETKQRYRSDITSQSLPTSPSRVHLCSPQQAALTLEASLARLTALNAPRATVAHVSRVSAEALSNGTSQRLQTLNLQQKAALCAFIYHQKISRVDASSIFATPVKRRAAPTVGKLYQTYCALCKRENALHPLTNTEFVDIVSGLETLGLIGEQRSGRGFGVSSGTPSKKGRGIVEDRSIMCFVDGNELKACLEGVGNGILLGFLDCDD